MQPKSIAAAGISAAALGLAFGASAAQAATLSPTVDTPTLFSHALVAADNNQNQNNKPPEMLAAAKPAALSALASDLS